MKKLLRFTALLFWPFFLAGEVWKSQRRRLKKAGWMLVVGCLFLPLWLRLGSEVVGWVPTALFDWGLVDNPTTFPTEGPSMLPTFKEKDEVTLVSPK